MLAAEQMLMNENRRIRAEGMLTGRVEDAKNMLKEKIDIHTM